MSPRQRAARADVTPLTFRGPPHRLSSLVALPDAQDARAKVEARLEGAEIRKFAVRPLTREGLGMSRVTLGLPKSTPPGTYSGSVALGGQEVPIVVEVEPRPRLDVDPSRLSLEIEPGAEVSTDVTVLNLGNVPFDLPAASTFCVFDGSGVDHAFWLAFASDPPEGKERIDVLLDDLAQSHGGLVEVRARADDRTIAPGEARDVQVGLRFSDRLRPGHSYSGAWDADGLRLSVQVRVPERKAKPKPAKEAR